MEESNYRTQESHEQLMSQLKGKMSNDQYLVIQAEVPKEQKLFKTEQILDIFNELSFTESKKKALVVMQPFIDFIPSEGVVSIIKNVSFSKDSLEVLEVLAPLIGDLDEDNKQMIINSFSFSSDKQRAEEILGDIKPRSPPNPVYGEIGENVLTFIIDLSGSMDYTFVNKDGQTQTRLSAIKTHLSETIEQQLRGFQFFNIVTLHNSADKWQPENVEASPENIQQALQYIENLKIIGATNISAALELAFENKQDLEAIYLLTDGWPNRGLQTVQEISDLAKNLIQQRKTVVRINSICFMQGGVESQEDRDKAKAVLQELAQVSGGTYKDVDFL